MSPSNWIWVGRIVLGIVAGIGLSTPTASAAPWVPVAGPVPAASTVGRMIAACKEDIGAAATDQECLNLFGTSTILNKELALAWGKGRAATIQGYLSDLAAGYAVNGSGKRNDDMVEVYLKPVATDTDMLVGLIVGAEPAMKSILGVSLDQAVSSDVFNIKDMIVKVSELAKKMGIDKTMMGHAETDPKAPGKGSSGESGGGGYGPPPKSGESGSGKTNFRDDSVVECIVDALDGLAAPSGGGSAAPGAESNGTGPIDPPEVAGGAGAASAEAKAKVKGMIKECRELNANKTGGGAEPKDPNSSANDKKPAAKNAPAGTTHYNVSRSQSGVTTIFKTTYTPGQDGASSIVTRSIIEKGEGAGEPYENSYEGTKKDAEMEFAADIKNAINWKHNYGNDLFSKKRVEIWVTVEDGKGNYIHFDPDAISETDCQTLGEAAAACMGIGGDDQCGGEKVAKEGDEVDPSPVATEGSGNFGGKGIPKAPVKEGEAPGGPMGYDPSRYCDCNGHYNPPGNTSENSAPIMPSGDRVWNPCDTAKAPPVVETIWITDPSPIETGPWKAPAVKL